MTEDEPATQLKSSFPWRHYLFHQPWFALVVAGMSTGSAPPTKKTKGLLSQLNKQQQEALFNYDGPVVSGSNTDWPKAKPRQRVPKRKKWDDRYDHSLKGHERRRNFDSSTKGHERSRKYDKSLKGAERRRKYDASNKGRERARKYSASNSTRNKNKRKHTLERATIRYGAFPSLHNYQLMMRCRGA
jgi:hypothetical protein